MNNCQAKRIVYDPDRHPQLTGTFLDADNPFLLELEMYYLHELHCIDKYACEGDRIVKVDDEGNEQVLATNFDGSLVRSVDDAWCPRINLGECLSVCPSIRPTGIPTKSCSPKSCHLAANKPFVVTWPAAHGFSRGKVLVIRMDRQSILPAAFTLTAKNVLPQWLRNLFAVQAPGVGQSGIESAKFEFEADFDAATDCGVSEPITLAAGWWKITASMERDIDRNGDTITKTRSVKPRYIRIQ